MIRVLPGCATTTDSIAGNSHSQGQFQHASMTTRCGPGSEYLQWAFIAAAWVAVGCNDYFGGVYRRHRARGKAANEAITITAHRMCQIAWTMCMINATSHSRHLRPKNFPRRQPAKTDGCLYPSSSRSRRAS